MKKIFLLLLSIFTLGACEDELDLAPISDPGSNGFYKTTDDFIQAINGVYSALGGINPTAVGTAGQGQPDYYIDMGEVRSDNIYIQGNGPAEYAEIGNFLTTIAGIPTINNAWNGTYEGIMRANTVLDKLKENPGAVPDDNMRRRIEGEARFLRAYFYFDLVKWFGKVPVVTTFVSPTEALTIGRSPVSEVYDVIIADLEFAASALPRSYGGADLGRATSWAAKGILARVYMTRSGPKLHPDGPCLGSNEYGKAIGLLNEIIGSNEFSMLTNYADIFDYDNENNAEIIFDVQYGTGAGGLFPTDYYDQPWGAANLPFAGGNPGDRVKRVSDDLMSTYEMGDKRVAPTVLEGYLDAGGNQVDNRFFIKFIDKSKAGGDRFMWPINFPVLRYTDVLMLKAECILQGASGTQGDVDKIVSEVRDRAGLGPVSNVTLDMLLAERRKEFAAECLRWDDLVRTGKVVDVMNNWRAAEDASGKVQPVSVNSILYPIPQNQLDVKQGLYDQNPGY